MISINLLREDIYIVKIEDRKIEFPLFKRERERGMGKRREERGKKGREREEGRVGILTASSSCCLKSLIFPCSA